MARQTANVNINLSVNGRQKGGSMAQIAAYQQNAAAAAAAVAAQLEEIFRVPEELTTNFPHSKRVGNYLIGRALGEGAFAKVKLGLHVPSGMYVAIKIISKETIKNDAYMSKHYRREPKLLQLFVHPNIVQLYEVLETDHSLYLIMELCDNGDVVQLLKHGSKPLSELETRRLMRQLLSAVEYIHRMGVLHRDLKAENFLLSTDSTLKITDFGLSTTFRKQVAGFSPDGQSTIKYKEFYHQTQCGSPAYASPEVLSQHAYCTPADVWSLGVNMFYMLHSKLPFMVEPFSMHALLKKVRGYDIEPIRPDLSHACVDILRRLLCLNENERITILDAMNHPWITNNVETGEIEPLETYKVTKAAIVQGINRTILKYVCTKAQRAKSMSPVDVIQIISSNTPHELNAMYHLLLKKLADYCDESGISLDDFEARDDASKNGLTQHTMTSRSSTDPLLRNGTVLSQQQQVSVANNRQLRRPQANKQVVTKTTNAPPQASNRHSIAVGPTQPLLQATHSIWKRRVSDNDARNPGLPGRDQGASMDLSRPNVQEHTPVYVNLAGLLNASEAGPSDCNSTSVSNSISLTARSGNTMASVGNGHGHSYGYGNGNGNGNGNGHTSGTRAPAMQRGGTQHSDLYNTIGSKRPSGLSLPDVLHHSSSTPNTPTFLRRTTLPAKEEESSAKQLRRLSTTSGVITKPELSKQYYQRMSLSSNRVDTLGLGVQSPHTTPSTTTRGRTNANVAVSQPRTIQFAGRLTTDFNI